MVVINVHLLARRQCEVVAGRIQGPRVRDVERHWKEAMLCAQCLQASTVGMLCREWALGNDRVGITDQYAVARLSWRFNDDDISAQQRLAEQANLLAPLVGNTTVERV